MYNIIIIIMVVDLTKLCEYPNQRFHANLSLTLFLRPQTSMFLRQIPLLDINTSTCGYVHSSSLCPSHSSPYSLCHTHSVSLPPHFVPPATPLTLPRPLTLLHTTFHISLHLTVSWYPLLIPIPRPSIIKPAKMLYDIVM